MIFLVNLMFHRLEKFDGPIIGEGRRRIYECGGGLYSGCYSSHIFGGRMYIRGLMYGEGGHINGILR